jgi:predicted tellurium resistance membrane protein TerC
MTDFYERNVLPMEWLTNADTWVALATLTVLEIVLGIDNIIFISIITGRLPEGRQKSARFTGLLLAMVMRIGLLFSITLIMRLTEPFFGLFGRDFSGKDIILLVGGLFLIAKSTHEIHSRLEGESAQTGTPGAKKSFASAIVQIMILDIVFSLDSVITAVGMTNQLGVMIVAIVLAVGFMMLSSGAISAFVHRHPTVKMLALSFLLLIGVTLIAEGFGQHIEKGYIYFAMAFSVFVEMLNIRTRRSGKPPVRLREPYLPDAQKQTGQSNR